MNKPLWSATAQERRIIQRILDIPAKYRDKLFTKLLEDFIDEQERLLACIEFHESEQEGRRYMECCAYDRDLAHDYSLQGVCPH